MAMLLLGFDTLGLHRIYARCRVQNQASYRIMNKLGMRQEGLFRDDVLARGTWWSSIDCAILATDKFPITWKCVSARESAIQTQGNRIWISSRENGVSTV